MNTHMRKIAKAVMGITKTKGVEENDSWFVIQQPTILTKYKNTGDIMSFSIFWNDLQAKLAVGTIIKNWTTKKGYLGDQFKIVKITSNGVKIQSPEAETIQYVKKGDFEVTFNHWEPYCSRKFKRQELRDLTRFSKYTISIIKHLKQ